MKFFKSILASCLGVILAFVVVLVVGGIIAGAIAKGGKKAKPVKANSVLMLQLNHKIPEQTNNLETDLSFKNENVLGLHAITKAIQAAKEDKNIKGIYLKTEGLSAPWATDFALRKAIKDFKTSGKFVMAYSKSYSNKSYYLASVADEVYFNPLGFFDFRGFGTTIMFMKDMLDRIGVKAQVHYVGKYKSATEPLRFNKMSDNNRKQIHEFLEPMYNIFLKDIAESRGKTVTELKDIANEFKIRQPEDAVKYGLVDKVAYHDEVLTALRKKLGLEEKEKIKTVSIEAYADSKKIKPDYSIKEKIGVIYAEGEIKTGKVKPGQIGDDKYAKWIRKMRKNDKIKAIVLRVNSPGGSALASENIWREVKMAKDAGKPVVVSMGDYAASGGYYISCAADTILAEPNTITGSIGVFGIIPDMSELMNEKLGIHYDTVRTGKFSTGLTPVFPLTDEEGNIIQDLINNMYSVFLQRVADGRGMTVEQVHEIAQGRVWTGEKAMELGLVDGMGNLDDAIEIAANLAGLDQYRLTEYPKVKDPFQRIIDEILHKDDDSGVEAFMQSELGDLYPIYQQVKSIKDMDRVQARLPYYLDIH